MKENWYEAWSSLSLVLMDEDIMNSLCTDQIYCDCNHNLHWSSFYLKDFFFLCSYNVSGKDFFWNLESKMICNHFCPFDDSKNDKNVEIFLTRIETREEILRFFCYEEKNKFFNLNVHVKKHICILMWSCDVFAFAIGVGVCVFCLWFGPNYF